MGEKPEQIRLEIEEARDRLGQNLNALEYRVREATNWRYHFYRHPWYFVGGAFAASFLVSLIIGRTIEE
jgi:hypothetical protein